MSGYANVRNMCLLAASILSSDVTILIDDDEVFESSDFISRATEFIGSVSTATSSRAWRDIT
jgi:hypothetical protein